MRLLHRHGLPFDSFPDQWKGCTRRILNSRPAGNGISPSRIAKLAITQNR